MHSRIKGAIGQGKMTEGVLFFVMPKTAYDLLRSLVGSAMCIGDSVSTERIAPGTQSRRERNRSLLHDQHAARPRDTGYARVLYTTLI